MATRNSAPTAPMSGDNPDTDDRHSLTPTPQERRDMEKRMEWLESKLGYLREKLREGEAFLSAQPGWSQIQSSINAIMGNSGGVYDKPWSPNEILSQTKTNRIAKISEDLKAMLTDIKPFWTYSIANRRFEQQAAMFGKAAEFWYQRQDIDMVLSEVVQWNCVAGSGYLFVYYNPDSGDQEARSLDPRCVIPINPRGNRSLEQCDGVIIKERVPVAYLRERYHLIIDSESDGSSQSMMGKMADFIDENVLSPMKRALSGDAKTGEPTLAKIPSTNLYTCFLKDYRKNSKRDLGDKFTNRPIEIGQFETDRNTGERKPANNWSYVANVGDKLFPNRRMIMWAGDQEIYDGPNIYWHGCASFPITKLTLNPQPWSWLGRAVIWDLMRLQESLNRLLRIVDNHSRQVAKPGVIADKNNVPDSVLRALNTEQAGYKVRQNPMAGKGIQIVNPPPLDAAIFTQIAWICDEMEKLAGTVDVSALMNLKQLPSNSTVESIMNAMTPALRARSRVMEAFLRSVAMQFAYNYAQFTPLSDRIAELGVGGITLDDFDFDEGSLIPDYVHNEDFVLQDDENGQKISTISPEALRRGPRPRWERAQELLRRLVFKVNPGSLLNPAQMERTLIYFQLTRAGIMDPITLMEQLNIPNIGVEKLPDDVRTVLERIQWCMSIGLMLNVNAAGRKSSGQEPPQVQQQSDGAVRVSESG